MAADVPAPVFKAAPAPALYSWNGFYIGGQAGYAFGRNAINLTPDANFEPAFANGTIPGTLADNPRGVLGGIEYGTNWQFGRTVFGLESDLSFGNIKSSQTNVTTAITVGEQKLSWFNTTRARAGYTVTDNVLLYATGGLASARANVSSSVTTPGLCGGVGNCPAGSASKILWGWTVGGGLEYGVGRWSVKAEYLRYDLGNLNYNMTDPTAPGAFIATSTKFSGHIVRAGLNYRFERSPLDIIFGGR
jgi:outer membrane immunogenic protein